MYNNAGPEQAKISKAIGPKNRIAAIIKNYLMHAARDGFPPAFYFPMLNILINLNLDIPKNSCSPRSGCLHTCVDKANKTRTYNFCKSYGCILRFSKWVIYSLGMGK